MDVGCAYAALRTALLYGSNYSFLLFLNVLIVLLRPDIVDVENRVKIVPTENVSDSYDFIIIGAGSAGSVLANRLTENANWTVLLLEAGDDEPFTSDVPMFGQSFQKTDADWQFKTEPSSEYCLGMNNGQCNWPRGKSLGGTTMYNDMLYVRGNRRDYDHWRDLGNPGWGYEDILPYFKKSEDMRIPGLQNSSYHGTGGYLTVERVKSDFPLARYFVDAGRDIGYDEAPDFNGESQVGFTIPQSTLRDGLRCSTAKAFLRSASHRKNLYVSTLSLVHKILVNQTTKTAYGVQFHRDGEKYVAYARAEVIVSAGALKSPHILMLSGIGPKKHLQEVGVEVVHDSPGVGQNLQDHVGMGGLAFLVDTPPESLVPTNNPEDSEGSGPVTMSAVRKFLYEKTGSLHETPADAALAHVNTKYAEHFPDYPDIQLILGATADNSDGGFSAKRYVNVRDDFYNSVYENVLYKNSFKFTPQLQRPKSRGYIKLRDANPNHHPVIVPNYFSDPYDLEVLIEGTKLAYNVSQTPTMKKLNATLNPTVIPQCAQFEFFSDDYLRCQARYYTLTAYHPAGTCKMGPVTDGMAVVDPRLRVYGVKGLRVADTSIMPIIVSGNTNAPTIMVGEKAADLIKEDYLDGISEERLTDTFIRSSYAQIPTVTTSLGTIQGTTLVTNHKRNISGFFGIPYAQPPIGEYRFSAPVAARSWDTPLNATDDSRMCTQVSGNEILGEEDCLYLNVFTPQLPENEHSTLLPVMVFIHGGGFNSGSKTSSMSGPEYLLDRDVLLVVPNYRLGPLGFLSTGDAVAPGNWGLKDIVLALQWVQENIPYFGGDPDVVTIFGHGAGGSAVRLLSLSDSTVGLFHRYITQSGSALLPISHHPRTALANRALQLGEHLGCPTNMSTLLISCLRELNSSAITNTSSIFVVWESFPNMHWGPTDELDLDGAILTDTPANLFAAGKVRDLPWMVGVTRDERSSAALVENLNLFQRVLNDFNTAIPEILQATYQYDNLTAYTAAVKSYYWNDLTANQSILLSNLTDLLVDAAFFYPAYKELQIQLPLATNPQYFYTFEYRGKYSNVGGSTTNYGVVHSDELLYLFPQTETLFGTGEILNATDLEMVDIMVELWTSFAIKGTPTITALNSITAWDAYSSLNNHLRIGNESDVGIGMEYSFHDEQMQFWERLFTDSLVANEKTLVVSAAPPVLSNIFLVLILVTYLRIEL